MAQTSTLLGIIESEAQIVDQLISYDSHVMPWSINKIGGYPVFSSVCKASITEDIKAIVCKSCSQSLAFVAQICSPVDDSQNDRILYLFACVRSECQRKQWIALRCVTPVVSADDNNDDHNDDHRSHSRQHIWIESQNDWHDSDSDRQSVDNQLKCDDLSAQSLTPLHDSSLSVFSPLYITVIEEPEESNCDTNGEHITQLMQSYSSDKMSANESNSLAEKYEKIDKSVYGNDGQTYHFFKQLSLCSQQIIRYNWEGKALLNSSKCKINSTKCELCGSDRCFEMQLMPALISYLRPNSDQCIASVDFGTIIIYSCSKNCDLTNHSFAFEECFCFMDNDSDYIEKKLNCLSNKKI